MDQAVDLKIQVAEHRLETVVIQAEQRLNQSAAKTEREISARIGAVETCIATLSGRVDTGFSDVGGRLDVISTELKNTNENLKNAMGAWNRLWPILLTGALAVAAQAYLVKAPNPPPQGPAVVHPSHP